MTWVPLHRSSPGVGYRPQHSHTHRNTITAGGGKTCRFILRNIIQHQGQERKLRSRRATIVLWNMRESNGERSWEQQWYTALRLTVITNYISLTEQGWTTELHVEPRLLSHLAEKHIRLTTAPEWKHRRVCSELCSCDHMYHYCCHSFAFIHFSLLFTLYQWTYHNSFLHFFLISWARCVKYASAQQPRLPLFLYIYIEREYAHLWRNSHASKYFLLIFCKHTV